MSTAVLLLNADYRPYKVISWVRAISLLMDEKADLVEGYADKVLRSFSAEHTWPAVVRLRRYVKAKTRIRFSRRNVLARDSYTCQYCGDLPMYKGRPHVEALTIDHVVPRAQANKGRVTPSWDKKRTIPVTCWENIVTACCRCNSNKGARTPLEAGMKLARKPKRPGPMDILRMGITRSVIPDEWKLYLPEDSRWRNYWDVELDED
ncbi:HNH endonuclease [archaeon]|jgi:5-methylcytosine-specific restriction endonuclease McrA|nr:HNH endonuclease [archaeon]